MHQRNIQSEDEEQIKTSFNGHSLKMNPLIDEFANSEVMLKLTEELNTLKPLKALIEIATAFSGGDGTEHKKIEPKHVLGSISKFVYS